MDSIIFSRIKELCAENNITLNKLEAENGNERFFHIKVEALSFSNYRQNC